MGRLWGIYDASGRRWSSADVGFTPTDILIFCLQAPDRLQVAILEFWLSLPAKDNIRVSR